MSKLRKLEPGPERHKEHESLIAEILTELFVPPLDRPRVQVRTEDGLDRRDIIFPNNATDGVWAYLISRFNADVILVEAKNKIGNIEKEDVVQIRDYLLRRGLGDFGILVGRNLPNAHSSQLCTQALLNNSKMIIIVTDSDLERMVWLRTQGEDPSIVIQEKRLDLQLKI